MRRRKLVKAMLAGLFLALTLVLASCDLLPLAARVDVSDMESVVGVIGGTEIPLEAVPPEGLRIACQGHAPAGVASIEFFVNTAFVDRANNTAAAGTHGFNYFATTFTFMPDLPGAYDLQCRTTDHEGRQVNSAVVTIYLTGEELPSPVPTEAGVPTATPTSTEVPPTAVPPTAAPVTATPTSTRIPPTGTPTATTRPPTPTWTATPSRPPTIDWFTASDYDIDYCQDVELDWGVSNAFGGVWLLGGGLELGVGDHDSRTVHPETTTTYTLRAHGDPPSLTTEQSLTIEVRRPSPTVPTDNEGPMISEVGESSNDMDWPYSGCANCNYPTEVTITAFITDPSGVSGAKVTYRVSGGSWQSIGMGPYGTGMYSATIGASQLVLSLNPPVIQRTCSTNGLEYYVQAFDVPGNSSQSPSGGLSIHYCPPIVY